MKKLYKIIVSLIIIVGVFSCEEDDNFKLEQAEGSFLIEVPSTGSSIVLDRANPNNKALTVTWEDTQNEGASYTIEFAKAATDFAESFTAGTTDSVDFTLSVEELNTFLINTVRIPQAEQSGLDIRVVASNGEISNIVTLSFTPFVIEVTELFVNGTFSNWDPTQGIPMNSSEFNIFTVNIDLLDGDDFNFLPSNTSDEVVWQLVENGSSELTKFGGVNLSGYTTGNYDITVDLNTNIFTIVEITFPDALFLVGAGVPVAGWGWDTLVEMTLTQVDVFEVTTDLVNDAFRFFTVNGDWGSGLNYPYFINDGYTIDANFEDAQDGDNNFRFVGTPGVYAITVNGVNKTITAVEVIASARIAVPGNHQGWDPPSAPQLEASSTSTTDYEGYVWLDGGHKFIGPDNNGNFAWGNIDWGDDGSNSGVLLEDGESDIIATVAGHYYITADTGALTYSETKYDWGIIGSATVDNWDSDQDMTYAPVSKTWRITLDLSAEEIKFRANDAWDWSYGATGADELLDLGGDNIAVPAGGNYTVVLDLSNPRAYTFSLILN